MKTKITGTLGMLVSIMTHLANDYFPFSYDPSFGVVTVPFSAIKIETYLIGKGFKMEHFKTQEI